MQLGLIFMNVVLIKKMTLDPQYTSPSLMSPKSPMLGKLTRGDTKEKNVSGSHIYTFLLAKLFSIIFSFQDENENLSNPSEDPIGNRQDKIKDQNVSLLRNIGSNDDREASTSSSTDGVTSSAVHEKVREYGGRRSTEESIAMSYHNLLFKSSETKEVIKIFDKLIATGDVHARLLNTISQISQAIVSVDEHCVCEKERYLCLSTLPLMGASI
ncbi:hypothetical protein LXL04_004451 [Taraxacum kok-saghyz]